MRKTILAVGLLAASVGGLIPASGQTLNLKTLEFLPSGGIYRNSITALHAEGDTLWISPYLNMTPDHGTTWLLADADDLPQSQNRVFSLDVEGQVIWAALGFTSFQDGRDYDSAGGFLYSTNGGRTFTYRAAGLDAITDTLITYGNNTLHARAIVVPEQSAPYDIDYDPITGTVWVASWASGLRKSTDEGRTWQRVVLPPDDITEITPEGTYNFRVDPLPNRGGNENHLGFSILVDEEGVIWAGSAVGLNRSINGGTAWRRFSHDGSSASLASDWVLAIEEQPLPGRNPVWIASWRHGSEGQPGLTVTRDGGETYEQVLLGERVTDIAFNGQTVYAAARESGLMVSNNGGTSWQSINHFTVLNIPGFQQQTELDVISVAHTGDALWVGTEDGLYGSSDAGRTWTLYRANVPLHPDEESAAVPDVDTYAYPNPFSPYADQLLRIRYQSDGNATVRIMDFGMNLIRELEGPMASGEIEATWDGKDDNGMRVANGVYFYSVKSAGETSWGKILVME